MALAPCSHTGEEGLPSHASGDATPSAAPQSRRLARVLRAPASTNSSTADASSMRKRLSRLQDLDGAALREEWRRLCRSEPPRISRDLLMRAVACRLQELEFGGLPKWAQQRLANSAIDLDPGEAAPKQVEPRLKPGARLVREWRGRTHIVIVLDGGFEFEGRPYRSLTQIAVEITGAHWSGPRFFGLKDRKRPTGLGEAPADAGSRKALGATEVGEGNERADDRRPEVISAGARRCRGAVRHGREVRHD
jgi:hypothetical protein